MVFKHRAWDFHPDAQQAHIAACEANAQGKFWEFLHAIYADYDDLRRTKLENLGAAVGLDAERLSRALDAKACLDRISEDIALADALEVNATPTMFLNGRRIVGDEPLEVLRAGVEAELARAAPRPDPK